MTEFEKELHRFNEHLQGSDKRTSKLGKLGTSAVRRILSGKKTQDKTIERTSLAV